MTWFRAEAGIARHEIIGALAEALKVKLHEAAGLYVFTLAGFADFQVDGNAAAITDTTVEQWALWRGKPGRFAAVFRRLCLEDRSEQRDAVGVVRGWWRQEALLREQQRSRNRPGQGTREAPTVGRDGTGKAPEQPPGAPAVPSRGNEDEDGNGDRTTPSVGPHEAVEPSATELRVLDRFQVPPDRRSVVGFLERFAETDRFAWVGRLNGYLDGLDFTTGKPTPAQIATACRDYPASSPPNPKHFRAFVLREMRPLKPNGNGHGPDGKTARTMATMNRFLQRHKVPNA